MTSRSGKANVRIHRSGIVRPVEPLIRPVEPSISDPRRDHRQRPLPGAPAVSPKNAELRAKLTRFSEDLRVLNERTAELCRAVLARTDDVILREAADALLHLLHPETP